jgi:YVTN family beta-propeller protein
MDERARRWTERGTTTHSLAWIACAALVATLAAGCAATAGRGAPSGPSAVVATVPMTDFGTGIAITPDGTRAYVAAGSKIVVIDTATNRVASTIDVGDMPYAVAMSPDGSRLYATDLMQREVWMIDTTSNSVLRKVDLGEPRRPVLRPGVAVSPDGGTVYATVSQPEGVGFDLLFTIDAASGAKSQHALGFHPGQLVAGRAGDLVWIAGCRGLCSDGALHGVDPASPGNAVQLPLPTVPGDLAISPDGSRVYVANSMDASVSVVDAGARRVLGKVQVGAEPLGVAVSPDGTRVYVTNFQSGTLSVIDAASSTVAATSNVGATPRAIALTPDGRRAYLTHSTSQVSVVDLTQIP